MDYETDSEGYWDDEVDYEFRKWIPSKSSNEPLFKNKETNDEEK